MEGNQAISPSTIGRRQLLMLMLSLRPDGDVGDGLGGITRLQKYLFLLEQEEHIVPTSDGFGFKPYKAGPYSRKIYDDLELLENLGLIVSTENGEANQWEQIEIADLSFNHLMGDEANSLSSESGDLASTADSLQERKYTLTEKGRGFVSDLLAKPEWKPFAEGIRKVKSRFSRHSLQDLLYYVYTKYEAEGWTSESEIREQVLARGRRRG